MISTILRTFIIYCIVSLCVRLMGKRQLGELQPGELVITILISEIAASPITDSSVPMINGILPLLLLVSLEIISSVIARKSVNFRYLADGKPVTVIKNGTLQQGSLKTLRFTIDDILSALRQKDIFNIEDVEYAVAETNGTLSVLPKISKRNASIEALQGKSSDDEPCYAIVIDGKLISKSIEEANVKKEDVEKKLQKENITTKNILLMTVNKQGAYTIILKSEC